MQLHGVAIALRQRMPWEATDIGVALVRDQGKRIFAAWCLVTLPVWMLVNALGFAIDMPWLALLVMWWLKPLFDRVPLYSISRTVFGRAPDIREIVRAQFNWGWREIGPWLLWRRLHPGRLMLLPVDLLEHASGSQRRERVRVLTKGEAGPRSQLAMLGMEFELALSVAVIALALMLVPTGFLSDATTSIYRDLFDHPPSWAPIVLNAAVWFGTSLVEPFLVGAGFGLYLNRRVQLEAWDVEHAFRRMAARLSRAVQPLCLLLLLAAFGSHPAQAEPVAPCPLAAHAAGNASTDQGESPVACRAATEKPLSSSLPKLFGADYRNDGSAFASNVKRANAGMSKSVRDWEWVEKNQQLDKPESGNDGAWLQSILDFVALVARYWLWILAVAVLAFVLYHRRLWMSWVRDLEVPEGASPIDTLEQQPAPVLPSDIPAAVRALWVRGEQRAALALLYQAAVQRLAEGLGTPLPPGATEGECLARSRQLNDRRYAGLFARIVGCWQTAAYARRMPETGLLEGLLDEWVRPAAVTA